MPKQGLPFNFCLNPDSGLPLPDLTLYLTVPPEVAASRASYGTERYETMDMQTSTRAQFALVAEEVRTRHGEAKWVAVNANASIEEVEEKVWKCVKAVSSKDLGPLGTLWSE